MSNKKNTAFPVLRRVFFIEIYDSLAVKGGISQWI